MNLEDKFLTNRTEITFLSKLKGGLRSCKSFSFSVSFIKYAGLQLFEREIIEALDRGAKGRIITSSYQNFTDTVSLNKFLEWSKNIPISNAISTMPALVTMDSIQRDIYLNMMIRSNSSWVRPI